MSSDLVQLGGIVKAFDMSLKAGGLYPL